MASKNPDDWLRWLDELESEDNTPIEHTTPLNQRPNNDVKIVQLQEDTENETPIIVIERKKYDCC